MDVVQKRAFFSFSFISHSAMLLKHTVYVITGANRGFGKVIAEVIASKAKEKTSIILVGRNRAELETIQLANVDTYFIGNISLEGAIQTEETIVKSLEDMMKVRLKDITYVTHCSKGMERPGYCTYNKGCID